MANTGISIVRTGAHPEDFARRAADHFIATLETFENPLVTLPTGATPLGMYGALVTHHAHRRDLWERMRFVALDEYAGLPTGDPRLFYGWLRREFLDHVGLRHDQCVTFDSATTDPHKESTRMEEWLRAHGPIDIAVLGLGGNGHIAFNEPGSAFDSPTRLVTLTADSRAANAAYWGDIERVPRMAMTLGLGALSQARHSLLLVSGGRKADILARTLYGVVTTDVPATYLRAMKNVTIIADDAALGL